VGWCWEIRESRGAGLGVCAELTDGVEAPGEVLELGEDGLWRAGGADGEWPGEEGGGRGGGWGGSKDRVSVEVCGGQGPGAREGKKRVTFVHAPDVDRVASFFRSVSTSGGDGGGGGGGVGGSGRSGGERGGSGGGGGGEDRGALIVWSIPISELLLFNSSWGGAPDVEVDKVAASVLSQLPSLLQVY
jgi:hypothetical protein